MKLLKSTTFMNAAGKTVPVIGYLTAFAMLCGGLAIMAGTAVLTVFTSNWLPMGFGFVGAAILGGQGVLALQRQLETTFCK